MMRKPWLAGAAFLLAIAPVPVTASPGNKATTSPRQTQCSQDGSVCVERQAGPVSIPFTFNANVKCTGDVVLEWRLQDGSGSVLDKDERGDQVVLATPRSGDVHHLKVTDFYLKPATSREGLLIVAPTCLLKGAHEEEMPAVRMPVVLDQRTTAVRYAAPAEGNAFEDALVESAESDPAHPVAMKGPVSWKTEQLLHVKPGFEAGAAAEASARFTPGQSSWHVVGFRQTGATAHLTLTGSGWAGVTHYLTGLHYLLEETVTHQRGIQRLEYDSQPDVER